MISTPLACRTCGCTSLRGCLPPDLSQSATLTEDDLDYLRRLRSEGWRRCTSCNEVIHVDTLKVLASGDAAIALLETELAKRGLRPPVAEA